MCPLCTSEYVGTTVRAHTYSRYRTTQERTGIVKLQQPSHYPIHNPIVRRLWDDF